LSRGFFGSKSEGPWLGSFGYKGVNRFQ